MGSFLLVLLYLSFFYLVGMAGYKLYVVLNRKIKSSETGLQLLCYSLLLFSVCAVLLVGGLYLFIELYAFLSRQQP